jgi:hypothetical protein
MNQQKIDTKTDKELCAASEVFYYEIWMFNEMVKSLLTQPPQPGNPQYNALVESFVQHMRNLIEFFYPSDKVHPDTIIAAHYQNQWERDIPGGLDGVRTRAHKLLAHLTYDRIKDDKGWEYGTIKEIREHLNGLFEKWFKDVPPDRIGEKLRSYKVPPINIIETPNAAMIASTGTAYSPGVAVTRKLIK